MKKIILLLILLQGLAMSDGIQRVDVNGTKVPMVFEQSSYLPLVSMKIVFQNSGALYDTTAGLASLSANLLMEGTAKDGSAKFATKLENSAISLSVTAGIETLSIEISSLKSQFPKATELLKELLLDPNYTEETLEYIKRQKIGSLTQKKSDFDYIASLGLKEMLFDGTDMGRPRSGTIESISTITIEQIKSYIGSHLGRDNAIVVIGGDIDLNSSTKILKDIVSILPIVDTKPSKPIDTSKKRETHISYQETQQAYIYFGSPFHLNYSDPKQYMAKVAGFILGGSGFGSRLMEEIRVKRGLAYSAYGHFVHNHTTSYLSGYLQTKLENEREAKELIQSIVDKFIKDGITQKELDATKEFLLGSEPLRNETLHQRLNRSYNDFYYDRDIGYSKKQLRDIESLKLDEINSFIKSHSEIADISYSIVTKRQQ